MIGEGLSLPSAGIMTSAFVDAAELMGRVLGADEYPFVTIEHPMASATAAELHQRGRDAADRCAALLVVTGAGTAG